MRVPCWVNARHWARERASGSDAPGKEARHNGQSDQKPTTSFHLSSWWLLDRRNPQGFASKHLRQHDARPRGGGSMDSWKHGSSPFPARTILEHPPDQLCARGFPPCPARTPAPQATCTAGTAQLERHKRPRVCCVVCAPEVNHHPPIQKKQWRRGLAPRLPSRFQSQTQNLPAAGWVVGARHSFLCALCALRAASNKEIQQVKIQSMCCFFSLLPRRAANDSTRGQPSDPALRLKIAPVSPALRNAPPSCARIYYALRTS